MSDRRNEFYLMLTKTNLLVVSDTSCGLLCQEFFGVKEHSGLLLESSLSLHKGTRGLEIGKVDKRLNLEKVLT